MMNPYNVPNQGWQCPKCQKIYSPTTIECWQCNNKTTQTWGSPITCGTTGSTITASYENNCSMISTTYHFPFDPNLQPKFPNKNTENDDNL